MPLTGPLRRLSGAVAASCSPPFVADGIEQRERRVARDARVGLGAGDGDWGRGDSPTGIPSPLPLAPCAPPCRGPSAGPSRGPCAPPCGGPSAGSSECRFTCGYALSSTVVSGAWCWLLRCQIGRRRPDSLPVAGVVLPNVVAGRFQGFHSPPLRRGLEGVRQAPLEGPRQGSAEAPVALRCSEGPAASLRPPSRAASSSSTRMPRQQDAATGATRRGSATTRRPSQTFRPREPAR